MTKEGCGGIKRLSLLLCFALLLGAAAPLAPARAEAAVPEAAFDGYIVALAENPASLRALGDSSAAVPYLLVESLEEAQELPPEQVEYIEPNYIVELFDAPNDPLYVTHQWNLQQISAEAAYAQGLDGAGVKVGFVDSGILSSHEDLDAGLIGGRDFTKDGNAHTVDLTGHGTFGAGILAAQTDNGLGIAGIAPRAQVMAYRAFSDKTTTMDAVVDAINAAVDDGCQVLNMSFGTTAASTTLRKAIERAEAAGVVMVAAVGNQGATAYHYPANYPAVIGAGSVNEQLQRSSFSQMNSSVFVVAPGEEVFSLGISEKEKYTSSSGTSFAAPVVSAMAALALGYDEDIDMQGIRHLLQETARDDAQTAGYDTGYGHGIVDIAAFVAELQSTFPIHYTPNGGELPVGAKQSYTVRDNSFALPIPEREGYLFAGWYEAADLSGDKVESIAAGSLGRRSFYAGWTVSTAFELESVFVRGQRAQWRAEQGDYYALLPYGTDLSALTPANIVATPVQIGSLASASTADGGASWIILVQAGANEQRYRLALEVASLHVNGAQRLQTGTATPAPMDGRAAAVPYTADLSGWFQFEGQDTLPDDFAVEIESSGGGECLLEGGTLRYTPEPGAAAGEVQLTLYGVTQGRRTPDAVTVTIAVAQAPVSQSLLEDEAQVDLYRQSQAELELQLYGNRVTGAALDLRTLAAEQYRVTEISTDGKTHLVVPEETLAALPIGQHDLLVTFSAGEPQSAVLTLSDSAPRYTVTFTDRDKLHHSQEGVREGSTIALPAAPSRSGYTFEGWYAENGTRFTADTAVASNLSLTAKWKETQSVPGGGGTPSGGGAPVVSPAPAQPPAEEVPTVAGVEISTPEGHPAVAGADGSVTLPGGGSIALAGGAVVDAPTNTAVGKDGTVTLPADAAGTFRLPVGEGGGVTDIALPGGSTVAKGGSITLSAQANVKTAGGLHYTLPGGAVVTLSDTAPLGFALRLSNPFTDVQSNAWYYSNVQFVHAHGLLKGVSQEGFDPDAPMTRGMLVTVLHRLAGQPEAQKAAKGFTDLEADWYAAAVAWAAEQGIADGVGEGLFAPDAPLSRQDLATLLARFAGAMGLQLNATAQAQDFADADSIAAYAKESVALLSGLGILNGTGENCFTPAAGATRAQVAAMLHRFAELIG